ncbi:MAG: TlpA disulfide reductase family protein [Elusimicrobiota bacterium]
MSAPRPRLALALLAAALAAGCSRDSGPPAPPGGSAQAGGSNAAAKAPSLELKDLSGRSVRLSDFQGKVVLVDFWATYCGPCHESIPEFEALYRRHRAQGLEVVGVSMDAFTEHIKAFIDEKGMTYTVLMDPEQTTQGPWGVRGLPTTVLLDRSGRVRNRWTGYDSELKGEIEREISALLREGRS